MRPGGSPAKHLCGCGKVGWVCVPPRGQRLTMLAFPLQAEKDQQKKSPLKYEEGVEVRKWLKQNSLACYAFLRHDAASIHHTSDSCVCPPVCSGWVQGSWPLDFPVPLTRAAPPQASMLASSPMAEPLDRRLPLLAATAAQPRHRGPPHRGHGTLATLKDTGVSRWSLRWVPQVEHALPVFPYGSQAVDALKRWDMRYQYRYSLTYGQGSLWLSRSMR